MKRFLIKLIATFILNKDKKREFKSKHLKKRKNSQLNLIKESDFYSRMAGYNQEAFAEYKNAFSGKDVVVIGSGPSLNNYKPIEGAIHIGSNRAHLNKNLNLDFLFRQDFHGYDQEIFDCNIKKFIGCYYNWKARMCPESVFNRLTNANKYIIDFSTDRIPVDLSKEPLWHGGSVAFSVFQFALWTNPKRIYIVGCDSAGQVNSLNWNHFDDKNKTEHNQQPITALVDGWKKLAKFAETMYPDVEIISINPVGLKGLFKDEYK